MERQKLYQQFKQLNWQQQLGNLASTLANISSQSTQSKQDKLTRYLIREAALMIDWCADNVPSSFLVELAAMHRELLTWHQVFPIEEARILLALHTRHQSDRVLQVAGLLINESQNNLTLEEANLNK